MSVSLSVPLECEKSTINLSVISFKSHYVGLSLNSF